ncbi:hypothetical protein CROQUDRAFT_135147 [Cronartium quercuum f. sp. fusiforme G11]|uniref:Uncharacterized protein n=1 Tax=Cronartium quercuum f. sp. fusiforme G11 TaxID=708437 RepID=A0A9P6T8M5_9BASI|nr:hypothetical protein CROQUDRAFT_135147 [Cronartium quercuum f. sp. fusiforme G11]
MTISKFDSQFRSLGSNTTLTVNLQIETYEKSLNPGVNAAAIVIVGWNTCSTLDGKIQWRIIVGGMAAQYATLPSDHPLSTRKLKYAVHMTANTPPPPTAIHVSTDPAAMQFNAICRTKLGKGKLHGVEVKHICWAQQSCFFCLETLDAKHGVPLDSHPCPNKEDSHFFFP